MGVKEEKRGRKRRWYYKSGIFLHMGCCPFYPEVKERKKNVKAIYLAIFGSEF
jgi:hypothetical protein